MTNTALQFILITGTAFGIALVFLGMRRWRRRRIASGTLQGLCGITLLLAVASGTALLFNVYTYQRLSYEQPIAELRFNQVAPQHFRVLVQTQDGNAQRYDLRGDEWQLDTRILKWHGLANLLGLDAAYRLERLGGRYRLVKLERTAPRTVYRLYDPRGIDLWELARRHPNWLPGVDAIYGSAAYLPMADNARFAVSHGQSGLIARPLNTDARTAVEQWQ